jgi:ankyrin repeat protein
VKNNCSYTLLSKLLSFGADLLHTDITGRTPLHTYYNSATQSLIEYHYSELDYATQDSRGMTIAQYVAWTNRSQHIDLLRCCQGDMASLACMANKEGKTPFHFACQRGNVDLVTCFLGQSGIDVSSRDYQGRALLHYATESSRGAQVIEALIQKGADIQALDIHGRTVMHYAVMERNLAAVRKLITVGAVSQVSVLDDALRTPLELAVSSGDSAVVELLRSSSGMVPTVMPSSLTSTYESSRTRTTKVGSYKFPCLWTGIGLTFVAVVMLSNLIFSGFIRSFLMILW